MGYDYLHQMESYLRETLQTSLVDTAFAVAGALNEKSELFDTSFDGEKNNLYVHRLNKTFQLDGYTDDWESYIDWSDTYQSSSESNQDSLKLIISKDELYYYVLMQIVDDELKYSTLEQTEKINGDHIVIVYRDQYQRLFKNYIAPSGPGLIRPYTYEEGLDAYGVETRYKKDLTNTSAVWQTTEDGYNVEIKIPIYLIGERMGFIFNDIDDSKQDSISTFGEVSYEQPGRIISSSQKIESIIHLQGRSEGRRIWVLDNAGQVLASDGSLRRIFPDNAFNIIYTLLLPPAYDYFKDDLAGASRLQGAEVKQALTGKTQTRWRSSPDGKAVIVSAATPVWFNNQIIGAVVIEETTNNIQIMQRQVLASLFNKTLLIFFIIVFLLLLFASRLSARMIKLNSETTEAIDEYGKVKGQISVSQASDEIGELSRSFSNMLDRLQQYHFYLEGMASRLSHELRTPMAMVKSSLDRLKTEQDELKRDEALIAAESGLLRLQTLLTRLSEAARLEQALQDAEKEKTNLNEFLEKCVEGYQQVYPETKFELNNESGSIHFDINRDLFFQMLDKLVANAVDFSSQEREINITFRKDSDATILQVINYGSILPDGMFEELFNSMVSVRKERSEAGPHLGLGLYISKLIAEFHGGKITATNLKDEKGVCLQIVF